MVGSVIRTRFFRLVTITSAMIFRPACLSIRSRISMGVPMAGLPQVWMKMVRSRRVRPLGLEGAVAGFVTGVAGETFLSATFGVAGFFSVEGCFEAAFTAAA